MYSPAAQGGSSYYYYYPGSYVTGYYSYDRFAAGEGFVSFDYQSVNNDIEPLYDYFVVRANVFVDRPGLYGVSASLYAQGNNNYIASGFGICTLEAGYSIVEVVFNSYEIRRNAPEYGSWYLGSISLISGTTFETLAYIDRGISVSPQFAYLYDPWISGITVLSVEKVDSDSDGYYDFVETKVLCNVTQTGTYRIQLSSGVGWNWFSFDITETLSVGSHVLTFRHTGQSFIDQNLEGIYHLNSISFYKLSGEQITSHNLYYNNGPRVSWKEFEPAVGFMYPINSPFAVDSDGNGKYDFLYVPIRFTVEVEGVYIITSNWRETLTLTKWGWNTVAESRFEQYLTPGTYEYLIPFAGTSIYSSGYDGPYTLSTLILKLRTGQSEYIVSYFYGTYIETLPYLYTQFEQEAGLSFSNTTEAPYDADNDGFYDTLYINVTVDIRIPGTYSFAAVLQKRTGEDPFAVSSIPAQYYAPGRYAVSVAVSSTQIALTGWNGSFYATVVALMNGTPLKSTPTLVTRFYNYTDWYSGIRVIYSRYELGDRNGDMLAEELVFVFNATVNTPGTYLLYAELISTGGWQLGTVNSVIYAISAGEYSFRLSYSGSMLYSNGQNPDGASPYTLRSITLGMVSGSEMLWLGGLPQITTGIIPYTAFAPPEGFTGRARDYGVDTDNNSFYNFLKVEMEVFVPAGREGLYRLVCSIYDPWWNQFEQKDEVRFLSSGFVNISIEIDGTKIYMLNADGSFKLLNVYLYRGNNGDWEYVSYLSWFATGYYNHNLFERPSDRFNSGTSFNHLLYDADSNGKYDYLNITVSVNIYNPGGWLVKANLVTPAGAMFSHAESFSVLSEGTHNITLSFPGTDIWASRYSGVFNLADLELIQIIPGSGPDSGIRRDYVQIAYTTPFMEWRWFEPAVATLNGNYTLQAVDSNSNSRIDFLIVGVGLNITEEGAYRIEAELRSFGGSHICNIPAVWGWLSEGQRWLYLNISGPDIYYSMENGPYLIANLKLYKITGTGQGSSEEVAFVLFAYITPAWLYTDFDSRASVVFVGNDAAYDTEPDGYYDYVAVDVLLNITQAGNYMLSATFRPASGNFQMPDHETRNISYYTPGLYVVRVLLQAEYVRMLKYNGSWLISSLILLDMDREQVLESYNDVYLTARYNWTSFEPAPVRFEGPVQVLPLDENGDGFIDGLRISAGINCTLPDSYVLMAVLKDGSGRELPDCRFINYSAFSSGIYSANLSASGNTIWYALRELARSDGINWTSWSGTLSAWIALIKILDFEGGEEPQIQWLDMKEVYLGYYNITDFQPPAAYFTGVFREYTEDNEPDGLFNYLYLNATVTVTYAGYYNLKAEIRSAANTHITDCIISLYLEPGTHTIKIPFPGSVIRSSGISGPYYITDLSITQGSGSSVIEIDRYPGFVRTAEYMWYQFQTAAVSFTGNFSHALPDISPADGLYDALVIYAQV
ncbi:MAG: hypothetical protein QW728_02150, partial [Thermoplasmata archaeon]